METPAEVKPESKGKRGKRLDHMRLMRGHRGDGYTVEHHFVSEGGGYFPPEHHAFGKAEGGKFLAHVGKVMGVPASGEEAGEAEHNQEAGE